MQKSMKFAVIVSVLALVSWQATLAATTPAKSPDTKAANTKPRPMEGDANGDGTLSRQEWLAEAQQRAENGFKRRDANADGIITREEMRAFREQNRRPRGNRAPAPKQ